MAVVQGEAAKEYTAVRLDSFANVNSGELVYADDMTGLVKWLDRTGNERSLALGERSIRIIRRIR